MIITCVRSGLYYIINGYTVIGYANRLYRRVGGQTWHDGYEVVWIASIDKSERFRTLKQIHEKYPMDNHPGYNAILKGQK